MFFKKNMRDKDLIIVSDYTNEKGSKRVSMANWNFKLSVLLWYSRSSSPLLLTKAFLLRYGYLTSHLNMIFYCLCAVRLLSQRNIVGAATILNMKSIYLPMS